MYCLVFSVLN